LRTESCVNIGKIFCFRQDKQDFTGFLPRIAQRGFASLSRNQRIDMNEGSFEKAVD